MANYLTEAFKAMEELEDGVFSLDVDGMKKLDDFLAGDVEEAPEKVIDMEAESPEELKDSYVGKILTCCNVCHQLVYNDADALDIDFDTQEVNVGVICPNCGAAEGYTIIGKVEDCCEDDLEDTSEEEPLGDDVDIDVDNVSVDVDEEEGEEEPEEIKEGLSKKVRECSEKKSPASKKDLVEKKERRNVRAFLRDRKIDEGFEKVEVETEDQTLRMAQDESGKVSIEAEPKNTSVAEDTTGEVVAPLDDADKANIALAAMGDEGEEEEISIEETSEEMPADEEVEITDFDEESFDDLGESYLKEVYDNVSSYKTIKGTLEENKLMLEGVITFNSGKKVKTDFIFESDRARNSKYRLIGENAQITPKRNAFKLTALVENKKLISESLNYNYRGKDAKNGSTVRLYGTVRRSK